VTAEPGTPGAAATPATAPAAAGAVTAATTEPAVTVRVVDAPTTAAPEAAPATGQAAAASVTAPSTEPPGEPTPPVAAAAAPAVSAAPAQPAPDAQVPATPAATPDASVAAPTAAGEPATAGRDGGEPDTPDAPPVPVAAAGTNRPAASRGPGPAVAVPAPAVPDAAPTDMLGQAELNRLAGGTQRLDLEIDTANLGRVRVEAVDQRGAVSIQIHADRPEARAVLDQQLGGLHRDLAGADLRQGNGHASGDRAGDRAPGAPGPAASGGRSIAPRPTRPHIGGAADRGVDVYA
jgi:flagellar hook-length control protein FliK